MEFDLKHLVAILLPFLFGLLSGGLAFAGLIASQITVLGPIIGGLFTTGLVLFLKPKVSLRVSSCGPIGIERGTVKGFRIQLNVTNRGRRIATKLTVSPVVLKGADPVKLMRLTVEEEDGHTRATTDEVEVETLPYVFQSGPNSDRRESRGPWKELRQGDVITVIFPKGNEAGAAVIGERRTSSFYSQDALKYEPGEYEIRMEIKCEDPMEKSTVRKNWKKKITLRWEDWSKYWLGMPAESN